MDSRGTSSPQGGQMYRKAWQARGTPENGAGARNADSSSRRPLAPQGVMRSPNRQRLVLLVAMAQPVQKHLLDGFVVGHEHVPNRMTADKVADFFG
jgi:hypothetical protein